jgi:enamine deaminase RidA (YjgF/YER057c/UK114 family)
MKKPQKLRAETKATGKHKAKAPTRMIGSIRRVNPAALYPPNGYTHVVEATGGRTIYISGQVSSDKNGNVVGVGDFRAQVVHVFENLKAALAAVDTGFGDVVKANYYVLDMSNITVLREVRSGYLGAAAPASTLVEVRRLARQEFLVEIEMIAVRAK